MPKVSQRKLTKSRAEDALKKTYSEAFSLEPSSIVQMFEIDLTDLLIDAGIYETNIDSSNNYERERRSVFRFHNSIHLTLSDIVWQGNRYVALPIQVEGYEVGGSGALPKPKLTIATEEEGKKSLSILKCQIGLLGDIIGAKVTRVRTFVKYLDKINFSYNPRTQSYGIEPPEGYDPDPDVEFPRDIYYIERKTQEDKLVIQYELSSIHDLEGTKIPNRLIFANRCPFMYRGKGCAYEFKNRKTVVHDNVSDDLMGRDGVAAPIATISDQTFEQLLGINYYQGATWRQYDKGEYNDTYTYSAGDFVYITKNSINYYFVAKETVPTNTAPPNNQYWISDQCGKSRFSCELRHGRTQKQQDGTYRSTRPLPFGGFPGADKLR